MTSWTEPSQTKRHDLAAVALFAIFFTLVGVATVTRDHTTILGAGNPHRSAPRSPATSQPLGEQAAPRAHSGLTSNLLLTVPIIAIGGILFFAWGSLERGLARELEAAQAREDVTPNRRKERSSC